jgi:hypothetical protein
MKTSPGYPDNTKRSSWSIGGGDGRVGEKERKEEVFLFVCAKKKKKKKKCGDLNSDLTTISNPKSNHRNKSDENKIYNNKNFICL